MWYPVQSNTSMQHYRCVVLCFVNIRQKGRFWAASLASGSSMPNEDRSMVVPNISNLSGAWPPWGLFQLSSGCANRIRLAWANSFTQATCPDRESQWDLTMEESVVWSCGTVSGSACERTLIAYVMLLQWCSLLFIVISCVCHFRHKFLVRLILSESSVW